MDSSERSPAGSKETLRTRKAEHADLKRKYRQLFGEVTRILDRADPLQLIFDGNRTEYGPEARTILPRLRQCASARDVRDVIDDEFARWFGEDYRTPDGYQVAASEIWEAWQRSGLAG